MQSLCTALVVVATILAGLGAWVPFTMAQIPVPAPSAAPTQAPQPAFPQPAPQPDPRVAQIHAQIKRNLENTGLRILHQEYYAPHTRWVTATEAKYAQPTRQAVGWQHLVTWGAMYGPLSQEPPTSSARSGQVWGKYNVVGEIKLEALREYARAWQAAQTDADRTSALNALWRATGTGIWDIERQQWVDEKDFVNKNFTS
jgi:hypothetical protein